MITIETICLVIGYFSGIAVAAFIGWCRRHDVPGFYKD